MIIAPKGWADFQHYKDRAPPWIKLHKTLLDNYEYQSLPVASRALAPMLWLLASDYQDGAIDALPVKLAFRFRMTEQELLDAVKPLIHNGFFVVLKDDSNALAGCEHIACLEAETEIKKETEAKVETKPRKRAESFEVPDWIPAEAWQDFVTMRKAIRGVPFTHAAAAGVVRELRKLCDEGFDATELLQTAVTSSWRTVYRPKQDNRQASGETAYQRSMRERVAEFSPAIARKAPNAGTSQNVIDMELPDVLALSRD